METFFIFTCMAFQPFVNFWKRRAPKQPEDPFDEISKIMDMTPISIEKHKWICGNTVHTSTTKHKMTFLEVWFFDNCELILLGPKQSSFHRVFIRNKNLCWWNLGYLGNIKNWKRDVPNNHPRGKCLDGQIGQNN